MSILFDFCTNETIVFEYYSKRFDGKPSRQKKGAPADAKFIFFLYSLNLSN